MLQRFWAPWHHRQHNHYSPPNRCGPCDYGLELLFCPPAEAIDITVAAPRMALWLSGGGFSRKMTSSMNNFDPYLNWSFRVMIAVASRNFKSNCLFLSSTYKYKSQSARNLGAHAHRNTGEHRGTYTQMLHLAFSDLPFSKLPGCSRSW